MLVALRVLLITPPMTQLNTPYPSTAYLTGFLRLHGFERLGLQLRRPTPRSSCSCACSARAGLARVQRRAPRRCTIRRTRRNVLRDTLDLYRNTIDAADSLPAGPRSEPRSSHRRPRDLAGGSALRMRSMHYGRRARCSGPFGALGVADRAKHLATALSQRPCGRHPRRHRPALRVRALCRIAGREPADSSIRCTPRSAAPHSLVDAIPARADARGRWRGISRTWCCSPRRFRATSTARFASRRPSSNRAGASSPYLAAVIATPSCAP